MKKRGPLVSVIIPTYNSGPFLRVTIQSILRQDYRNLEVIVVDDGSTDQTCEIIRSFKDPRIRFYQNGRNRGIAYTRTCGLKRARGKYVTFFDHDDIMLPRAIKKRVSFLEKHGKANAVFGYSRSLFRAQNAWRRNGALSSRVRKRILFRLEAQKRALRFLRLYKRLDRTLLPRFYFIHTLLTNLMLRRSFIKKTGALNSLFKVYDDTDFVYRAIQKTPFYFLNTAVKMYRIHGRNASLRPSFKELTREWAEISKRHFWRPPIMRNRQHDD